MVLTKQPNRYDIGDDQFGIDDDIIKWCEQNLEKGKWKVGRDGFLIDTFYLVFDDPVDEARFILKWR